MSRILIVDDDPGHRGLLGEVCAGRAEEVVMAVNGEEALRVLGDAPVDLMLLDMRMPVRDGLSTLQALRDEGRSVPTIVMTAYAEVDDAVRAMKLGAIDYLRKPIDVATLTDLVDRTLGRPGAPEPAAAGPLPQGAIFSSPIMRDLLDELARVARSDVGVLLVGETGTGKEVLAECLHRWGARPDGPLVRVNVAALPATLIESELFGHTKGAFTGADRERTGWIEQADKGTLFLDEIGEMPVADQPKLLRVLESGRVMKLGGDKETQVDFRLVAATNRDLESDIEAGRFRQDLYYRIAVVTIEVPPLRERPDDLLPLARSFLAAHGDGPKQLSSSTIDLLGSYAWPGNIRELKNAMARAAILSPGDRILPEHLPPTVRAAGEEGPRRRTRREHEPEGVGEARHPRRAPSLRRQSHPGRARTRHQPPQAALPAQGIRRGSRLGSTLSMPSRASQRQIARQTPRRFRETPAARRGTKRACIPGEATMHKSKKHSILIAIDDSGATHRALEYVARLTHGQKDVRFLLLSLTPPVPPEYLEHGGSEQSLREQELNAEVSRARHEWVTKTRDEALPVLERARVLLAGNGVEVDDIQTEFRTSVDQVAVARHCIETAREKGCQTVVIGRETWPWYRELFKKHHCEELVRHAQGLTVWIVQ